MVEWMENIEKAISKIMADKVYTSAEFKRERDNFHVRFFLSLALLISARTATGMDGTLPHCIFLNLKPVEISKNCFNFI